MSEKDSGARRPVRRAARRTVESLGPGESAAWSPMPATSGRQSEDPDVGGEIETLVNVLAAVGETNRKHLHAESGAKYWGPGRFRRALDLAVDQGRIRKLGRDAYAGAAGEGEGE